MVINIILTLIISISLAFVVLLISAFLMIMIEAMFGKKQDDFFYDYEEETEKK